MNFPGADRIVACEYSSFSLFLLAAWDVLNVSSGEEQGETAVFGANGIALCTNDVTNFWSCCDSDIEPDPSEFCCGKSRSQTVVVA